jgi:hypothetical protein
MKHDKAKLKMLDVRQAQLVRGGSNAPQPGRTAPDDPSPNPWRASPDDPSPTPWKSGT